MIKILQIIILVIISLLMMSASCDKGNEGCIDANACNYNKNAAIDDNSCWFKSTGCDCEDPPGSVIDCLGICDADILNDPDEDADGNCCSQIDEFCDKIVVGGCIDETNCKYDEEKPPTHNDGTCASVLSDFGGLSDGTDCDGICEGEAVMDGCDLCVGGTADYGQSWRIKITAVATFKLQDGTSMGTDTNSVTLGTSIYALDGYNGTELDGGDLSCIDCYIDFSEPPATGYENENNFIRFYFPHDDLSEWDEWGDKFDLPQDNLYFDRDIRKNDYHSLFTEKKGINWFAIIEPTLSDIIIFDENNDAAPFETILDSIYFQVSHLEGIKCSNIKFAVDREKGEIVSNFDHFVENNQLGISVDSDKSITLTINVSNICIQEQVYDQGEEILETCPDDF